MLEAIRAAENSIRLEMYIYTVCPIAIEFRDALVAAAERGVRVDVLVDAFGSIGLADSFWDPLRGAGGEFHWFNPLKFHCCGFRNHRKLLVCDEERAFVGGFNISTEYQGDGVSKGWHDLGLQINGPMAKELAGSFDTLFGLADFRHRRFTALRRASLRKIVSTYDGQLIFGAPGRGPNYLKQALLADLAKAKTVQIICAYFLPIRPLRRALGRVAKRGGKVQLILAGKSDVAISQLASRRFYSGFLRAGVNLYEYQPQILHAKLFVIDDVVYVGSANLDRRSFYINYELMLRLPNSELARQASQFFQRDLLLSQQIDPQTWRASRNFYNRCMEHLAFLLLARLDPYIARWQLKILR